MKDYPMITPTASDRTVRFADFPTLTQALDFAATGETGINLYSLRGELVEALPYAKLREQALVGGQGRRQRGPAGRDRR
jgi:fatty-acyl-CoA synthase